MPNETWTFFQAFMKSPRVVASVIPSSAFLKRRIIEAAHLPDAQVVVELGAGTGGTTRALLQALGPAGRLIAIERTADFLPGLEAIDDERLELVHGCASSIIEQLASRGYEGADAVVSGIPFSTMPAELCQKIAGAIHHALKPGGRFVAYQFSDQVVHYMRPVMGNPVVQHEILNVPPMRVFTWEKPADVDAAANAA
jgi:phospholipid N-methyltransferase